jgi:hypothetical protein
VADVVVSDPPRSKGVVSYVQKVTTGMTPHVTYCFDLSFDPEVAVGNTFFNNNAIVATGVGRDFGTTVAGCPSPQNDAKAVVRDTAAGEHGDVAFDLIFEQVTP